MNSQNLAVLKPLVQHNLQRIEEFWSFNPAVKQF
jgi:hypothetical protein